MRSWAAWAWSPQAEKWRLVAATGLLAVLFFPQLAYPVSQGLDPSYAFAISHFAAHGVRFGEDVVFTYGPLGFLVYPRPVGPTLAVATGIIGLLWLAFVWTLVGYHAAYRDRTGPRVLWALGWGWVALTCFLASSLVAPVLNNALLGLVCLWLMMADLRRSWVYAAGAAALVTVAFLVKPSLGLFCLAPLAAYAALWAWRDRHWAGPAALLAAIGPGVALLWLGRYGTLAGLGRYARTAWEFASGYAPSMGTAPAVTWPAIAAFAAALVALPLCLRDRRVSIAYLIFLPALAGYWRYGTVQSHHFYNFVVVVPIFLALVVPFIRPARALAAWGLLGVVLVSMAIDVELGGMHVARLWGELATRLRWPGQKFVTQVVRFERHRVGLEALSVERTAARRLPPAALAAIGRAPIDFYPWEMTYAFANDLAWRPHPTLQAYSAYTPALDRIDADFYAGPDAPPIVLWHATLPAEPMSSVEHRYVFNDEPAAVLSLLTHYRPSGRYGDAVLLRRRADAAFDAPRATGVASAALGAWLDVPAAAPDEVVRARLTIDRAPDALWRSLLPGTRLYHLDYELADGRVIERRLPPLNAASGVWVQPYVTGFDASGERFVGDRVRRIRLRCDTPWPQAAYHVQWEHLHDRTGILLPQ